MRNRDRILGIKISDGLLKSGSEIRNQHTRPNTSRRVMFRVRVRVRLNQDLLKDSFYCLGDNLLIWWSSQWAPIL